MVEIDHGTLFQFDVDLADLVVENPDEGLAELRNGLDNVTDIVDTDNWGLSITDVPRSKKIPELRTEDANMMIEVIGQISEVTQVQPHIEVGCYTCMTCGGKCEVITRGNSASRPSRCPDCDRQTTMELDERNSTIIDRQLAEVTARPEDTAGFTQSSIPVYFEDHLCGQVHPGDRVRLTGILRTDHEAMLAERNPDASREFFFEPVGVHQEQQTFDDIEPERLDEIHELAESDDLFDKLIESFAPHVVTGAEGYKRKLGIILQLFGGVHRTLPNGDTTRGDIHVLLLGEPGTAKSQYLKYAHQLSPKSVMASGKGASAAGLTAATTQSSLTNEWSVKAGAMVLANGGLAAIDELDKIQDDARKSLHEALEDQHVPINKAGQNVVLPAKTSMLAAANPKYGTFDDYEPLSEQINLGPALISRFDLIFSVSDDPDPDLDADIATNQFALADSELPDHMMPPIEPELFREYVAYARQMYEPTWADDDVKSVAVNWYSKEIRAQVADDEGENTPVGPRVNDALRRLATASAKARLSSKIEHEDVDRAKLLLESYLNTFAGTSEGGYDKLLAQGDTTMSQKKRVNSILSIIEDTQGSTSLSDIVLKGEEMGMEEHQIDHAIKKLKKEGQIYEPKPREYRNA